MAGKNECNADLDGKRAAIDLATSRPEDFSAKCWNIDNKLNNSNPEYARTFMSAMNNELESRQLLPKVELNMIAQGDNSALQPLQDRHKHVDTKDLVQAEDEYRSQGRNVEGNLVHGLIEHQQDIQDTHAERNFWGKNHGGIDADRVNRWAAQNKPDFYGAQDDTRDNRPNPNFGPGGMEQKDSKHTPNEYTTAPQDKPTVHDRAQDDQIRDLRAQLAQEKQEREMHAKIEAGVIKDAHHTVVPGETLRDMACLALHKAGTVHMSEGMIKHEEEKIRMINGLSNGEHLTPGTSLMLRTREEVDHETARRMAAYDNKRHTSQDMLSNFSIDHANRSDGKSVQRPHTSSNPFDLDYDAHREGQPASRPYPDSSNYPIAYRNRPELPPVPRQYDDLNNYSVDYGYRNEWRPAPRRHDDPAWRVELEFGTRPHHHRWTPPPPGFIN